MGLTMGRVIALAVWLTAWAHPAPAAGGGESPAPDAPDVNHGREIFENICSHCHHASHETSAVGAPGLMDVTKRRSEVWIEQWISGPEAFAAKDADAEALVKSNPYGLVMPTLPEMQDAKNRRDVIAFLKTLRGDQGK